MPPAEGVTDGEQRAASNRNEEQTEENQGQDAKGDKKKAKQTKEEKKPKKITLEFPVQELVPYRVNIDECIKIEREMQAADWEERMKADAKNAVEEVRSLVPKALAT